MGYTIYYDGELTVTPALSKSDAAIFTTIVNLETSDTAQPILDAIKRQKTEIPSLFSNQLEVSEDGRTLIPEEGESRVGVADWLDILLEHFFVPRRYALFGEIRWSAKDDSEDRGVIYVEGYKAEAVEDVIQNPGPSWKPAIFLSSKAKELVQQLVDTADDEGCSPDLTVVGAAELKALQDAIAALGQTPQ